jgi:hypothetical protein
MFQDGQSQHHFLEAPPLAIWLMPTLLNNLPKILKSLHSEKMKEIVSEDY